MRCRFVCLRAFAAKPFSRLSVSSAIKVAASSGGGGEDQKRDSELRLDKSRKGQYILY